MKKLSALVLLTTFIFCFIVNPASAILEVSSKDLPPTTILDYINFDWWKKLDDPCLEKYIVTAINNNNDIKTAALKIEQAKLNVMATRAGQLPTITAGVSPLLLKMPDTTKTDGSLALPIMASYELDLFGKNWDKTKSSKKLLEGAVYQTQTSDIAVISMVATVYYNIVMLDKIIEIQEKLTQDREEIYNLMKLSNDEGIVSTSDLIAAEKSYVLAQNDLLDYKKSRENALNALAVLIGDSPNNTKEYQRSSLDELGIDFEIPNEISSDIIVNRPDYKAIEKQLEAAGIDIRVAKKEFLPTINILGLLTFIASSSMGSMGWKNSLSLLGASADLPLFTGFVRVANLKLNKNKYEQLLQNYQKTNLTAIQEVNDSLYNLKSDNEKLLNNIKAHDIQQREYNYAESKYNTGVLSTLDLLQQKESLLYMKKILAQTKIDCYIDKISLYKTTGAKI